MNILIVDDSAVSRTFLTDMLHEAGYDNIIQAESMEEVFAMFSRMEKPTCTLVDLVLLDIHLPGKNGIEGCRELKQIEQFQDVPVIIISGLGQLDNLELAFAAGAIDYLTKPPNRLELKVRIGSALKLKGEIDRRKARERELLEMTARLEEVNRELRYRSTRDGLTGVANRYAGDDFLSREWLRAIREQKEFSVIMIDIDFFKLYNDSHGHLKGDECLKKVAAALQRGIHRPADLLVRYGGEEFMALLPDTDPEGALSVAMTMKEMVERTELQHGSSMASPHVSVSIGIATARPGEGMPVEMLIAAADQALYRAKQEGRNRICMAGD
ncbi:MAG: diguanylate cyclase response regulator [Betaproteobacteria bacterium HGW-Betaproteobacteria-9]|nr:MAG: diguanylate cyclase response regulator [Betaproteobacteria bacterium HGW-Betaproteobacteria-9]